MLCLVTSISIIFVAFNNYKIQTDSDGLKLFRSNCSVCHSLKRNENLVGPTLYLITKRRNEKWIFNHIIDSEFQIKNGDKHAKTLNEKYKNGSHPKFEELSGDNIKLIISFLKKANN